MAVLKGGCIKGRPFDLLDGTISDPGPSLRCLPAVLTNRLSKQLHAETQSQRKVLGQTGATIIGLSPFHVFIDQPYLDQDALLQHRH